MGSRKRADFATRILKCGGTKSAIRSNPPVSRPGKHRYPLARWRGGYSSHSALLSRPEHYEPFQTPTRPGVRISIRRRAFSFASDYAARSIAITASPSTRDRARSAGVAGRSSIRSVPSGRASPAAPMTIIRAVGHAARTAPTRPAPLSAGTWSDTITASGCNSSASRLPSTPSRASKHSQRNREHAIRAVARARDESSITSTRGVADGIAHLRLPSR